MRQFKSWWFGSEANFLDLAIEGPCLAMIARHGLFESFGKRSVLSFELPDPIGCLSVEEIEVLSLTVERL